MTKYDVSALILNTAPLAAVFAGRGNGGAV